jgi:predicted phage tail protein
MEELDIYGEKGGGGHTPTESKDTLKSQQTMRLLFALSEGEIDSVSDILVNSASISNFESKVVTWETRTGTLDQTIIKGFSEVEAPIAGAGSFPIELKHNVEKIYNLLGQYDAARITLSIDRLMKVTDQGDRVGYEVSLDVYKRRKLANGFTENWQLASTITKKGKCTNVYAWDVRVDKPAGTLFGDSWEVKIVRTSADDSTDKKMSKTFLSNIITITEKSLTYPKTALVGVTIYDAKTFGTSIPELKFRVKGIKFLLPTNYTASSRNYNESTPWNGSFKSYTEYTDNLAWVTYWVLRNNDWGLGISAADIDLGSFYTYAKYCDEPVPIGNTTEPRYTVHLQCVERENVPTFLMKLLTLGNANFSSNEFGQVKIVWDGANQPITKVVSNATVIDGMFDYTSNDLEGRTNLVNVTYAREDFFGDSDTVTHFDDSLITRYGLQTSDVILLGCKSEYQALRKARWTLYNNCYSGDLVTFKQLFQGAHYQIGELVSVMDSDNVSSNARHAIVKSASVAGGMVTVVIDREIILSNATYALEFVGTDGLTFSSKTINQTNGTFSTITYAGTDTPFISGTVLFKTTALTPRVIKVIKIDKDDSNIYTITGLTHHEDKYLYVDNTGTFVQPTGSYVNFDNFSIPPVTNLQIEQVHVSNGVVEYSKLAVSWSWTVGNTPTEYKPLFEVSYRRDAQEFVQIKELHTTNFDIEYPLPGVYEVYVWAVNPFSGIKSIVTTSIEPYNYRVAAAVSSLLPPTNVVVPNTVGVAFAQPDLNLVWSYPAANDTKLDKLKDYVVQVLDTATRTVKGTYVIAPNVNKGGDFVFSFAENSTIFGTPQRNFIVRVFSRDLVGDLSNYVEVNPVNAVPGVQSFDIISGVSSVYLHITTTPDVDVKGYQVWRSLTANFVKNASTLVYDGADTYITLSVPTGGTYYYALAAYDNFGKTGLNISGEQNSTPLSADATTWTKTGLQFTVDSVTPNKLNWTAGTIIRNGSFTYTIAAGTTTWTTGYVYVYFNPNVSQTTLQVTTTLLIAVSVGSYPIATYTGGSSSNIKGGDGNAFISGSQIIAGTVGASEIKAGSIVASLLDTQNAVITNTAQIANAVITNAAIKDTIMSTNYNPTTFKGWKIDKAGDIVTYGSLGLYDTNGNVVFAGGNFNWNNAKGPGVPQVGATRNVFLGNWTSGYNYVVGDIVMDALGYGWSCVTVHTSGGSVTTPVYPTTSNSYWTLYTIKGGTGPAGLTTATVYIYRRLAGANPPALPTQPVTYTFNSGIVTGLDNSWSYLLPTGTDPLYVSAATASAGTPTDTIQANEWASPVILAQNGTAGVNGVNGANGINTATIYLYQTTTTSAAPIPPSTDLTYTFSNGALVTSTGLQPDPWKRSLPTTGAYRWVTTATALGTGTTDVITTSEWAAVSLLAKDGTAAAYVVVNGEQAFKFTAGSSTPTVNSITLTASLFGGLTTYSWEYWSGAAWVALSGTTTNQTYALAYNNTAFTGNSIRIRCSAGGVYDEITILKLYDGSNGANGAAGSPGANGTNGTNGSNGANGVNAVNGYLTNETSTLPAASNGTVSSYAAAAGNFKVFSGTTDVTSICTFSTSGANSGLTCTITAAGAYSIAGTMNADTAVFTLSAVYSGATLSKVLNITRAKAGVNGTDGTNGTNGTNGATGPQGPAGAGTAYTGTGVPISGTNVSALAINGDTYFDTTAKLMWIKTGGVWVKVIPQIDSSNVSTFIASAAIGQAQIGSLAVGTLNIQGEAVTVENVIAINSVSVTKSTSATTWTNIHTYSTPANAVGYPTILDLQFPDTGTTSAMVGGSSVSYGLRVIDSSTNLVLASFSDTYLNRTRFLVKVSSMPAGIKIQRQIYYTAGTGYLVYNVDYKASLLSARTVKK